MAATADKVNGADADDELVDYEEEDTDNAATAGASGKAEAPKKGYVGIHSSGFKDFLLKPELLRAIQDCGFEHPSEGASEREPAKLKGNKIIFLRPAGFSSQHASADLCLLCACSPARVYTSGHPWDGCSLPGQVRHGQDSCLCAGNFAAA